MRKSRLRRTLKMSGLILAACAAVVAAVALAIQFRIHISNEWQQRAHLPSARVPGKNDSVIVFAPHSDDETLGCGGMLAMASKNGAKVRVVLVTNGDGFRIAVVRAYRTLRVTPAKCIEFAYRRQRETLKALAILGVPQGRVTFLGYPDRGIASLWDKCWAINRPYTSHATGWDHSPYKNSFTPEAPYCGESLIRDIEELLIREKPTDIYFPHPSDNHADHYATYCFVTAAVEQLESRGYDFVRKIRAHTYLVHRGDWPCPKGDHPDEPLAPPYALARSDTKWHSLDLPPDIADLKRKAIAEYATQTAMERGFLMSFARGNEIFGDLPPRRIVSVGDGSIRIDGDPDDWSGIPPAVVDPVGDYVVADMNKGGDVRSIYLCADSKCLYLRLDCVRNLSKRITYTLNFRGLNSKSSNDWFTITLRPPASCKPPYLNWAYRNNVLEVAIPREKLNFDDTTFVQVHTKTLKLTVGNTGWNGFELSVEPGDGEREAKRQPGMP